MSAFTPTSLILYVTDVEVSTEFYKTLLEAEPLETFDGFAVFALTGGFVLGLQARDQIDPKAQASAGEAELSWSNADRATVDRLHTEWTAKNVAIILEPTELAFGYTFVGTDPDGHRLRVCATDTSNLT